MHYFALKAVSRLIVILALLTSLSGAQPSQAAPRNSTPTTPNATDFERGYIRKTQKQLAALEPYVQRDPNNWQKLVDNHPAIDKKAMALAHEIINYQNALRAPAPAAKPRLADYPALRAFLTKATHAAVPTHAHHRASTVLNLETICGDFANPIPAQNPTHIKLGPYPDRTQALKEQGFHETLGYACGAPEKDYCRQDFTRGRAHGPCPEPAMRDQASFSPSQKEYVWLQEGEPNPEINHYDWPTWNWGAYVTWWHETF